MFRESRDGSPASRRRCKHRFPRCSTTGKVRYGERKDARLALEDCRRLAAASAICGVTRRTECRSYRCASCSGWHLTSQPARSAPKKPGVAAVATRKGGDLRERNHQILRPVHTDS